MFHSSSFILTLLIHSALGIYTNEVPVKLLEVESLADRYPATESEYRTSVTNGVVNNSTFHSTVFIKTFFYTLTG